MLKIKIDKKCYPDQYWLEYINETGVLKKVSLTGCANSFRLATDHAFDTDDGMQGVGWRYEEDGNLCYEIFCVGHLQFYTPLQPSLKDRIVYLFKGKKAEEAHKQKLEAFERALNLGGWKTVERPNEV